MRKNKLFYGVLFLAILFFTAPFLLYSAEPDLVILHTNDVHGRIEAEEGIFGMPRISTLVKEQRSQNKNLLVLDAGDALHGKAVVNQLDGTSAVATMNAAGYDAMVPGNHDFNYGYKKLLELEEEMEFSLLSANVLKDGETIFTPYTVKEIGEYRVGIIGLSTPDTVSTTHPKNIEGIEFGSAIDAAEHYLEILKEKNVDLIIVLGHLGLDGDNPSTDIVEAVDGIDLFVDGHSHSLLTEGKRVNNTLLVQANEYGKYLGRVEVSFSEGESPELKASLIPAKESDIEPDAEIEEMISEFRDEVMRQILGN